jgi:hypothetical protein
LGTVSAAFGAGIGNPLYTIFKDVNGSAAISISDLSIVASSFGATLPPGNPLGIPSVAAGVDSVFDNAEDDDHTGANEELDLAIDSIASGLIGRGKSSGAFLA